ncbi:hypothetical protein AB0A63_39740 [Lentzea sp. NPDC042327]|uniref:hypothetical protein n=1 Tax=Lentzea sp. NPDC042327 TaxID=3154801 RepID=UPI0033FB0B22
MSRVVAVVAAVLAVAIGLADRFAEPVAVPFGQDPGWLLPLLDELRLCTRYELVAVVVVAAVVAGWRRDAVVLAGCAGLLVFLWLDHPAEQGTAFLTQEDYDSLRVYNYNGFIAAGVLVAAAVVSGCRRASPR